MSTRALTLIRFFAQMPLFSVSPSSFRASSCARRVSRISSEVITREPHALSAEERRAARARLFVTHAAALVLRVEFRK